MYIYAYKLNEMFKSFERLKRFNKQLSGNFDYLSRKAPPGGITNYDYRESGMKTSR